jgi:putative inorganic carbon (HCO3(-)) transporter
MRLITTRPARRLGPRIVAQDRDFAALAAFVAIGGGLSLLPAFPIAVVLMIAALGLATASPAAAAAAVAASTPTIFHPVHIHGEAFSLLELSLLAGSFGLAARLTISIFSRDLLRLLRVLIGDWHISVAAMAIIVLGALSLLTIADHRHLPESVRDLRVVIVEPVAALVLARWSVRHDGGRLIVVGLMGAGLVVSIAALGQVLTGRGEVIGNGVARATGPYPHPNNLALYLERIGLVGAAFSLTTSRGRRLILPITLLTTAGLATTLSRGALLAAIAGGALLLVLLRPTHGWRWFSLAVAVSIGAFAIAAGDRLLSNGTGGVSSSRELIWRSSLRMIRDHPIFGVGLDQFLYQYAPRYVQPAGWPERYTSHPHDLILDVWLRLGLAGLALFIVLAVLCLRRVHDLRHADWRSHRSRLALAGAALLTGGAAHGLVDNGFFLPDLAVLTWIAIALLEGSPADAQSTSGRTP